MKPVLSPVLFLALSCILTFVGIPDVICQEAAEKGKLVIHQDNRIPILLQKHIRFNTHQQGVMDGYRIQIFFDSGADSKKRALDAKSEFSAKFPSIPAYISFQEPFFKIRVGDFRYKLQADGVLEMIKQDYPNAYTVKDIIFFPVLE